MRRSSSAATLGAGASRGNWREREFPRGQEARPNGVWAREQAGLLGAAEFFFEFGEGELDHGGATVGAGVGEVAGEEVVEEHVPFGGLEEVVGLDGVAADGLGDDFFAEAATFAGFAAFLLEIDEDGADEFGDVAGFDHGGKGVDQEGVGAEAGDADTGLLEGLELGEEEVGFAGEEVEGDGEEELLGGGVLEGHAAEHLLEEDAFVGGVLIDEDEAFGTFGNEIELGDAADDAEAEAVGDEGLGTGDGARRERVVGQREGWLEGERFRFGFEG